MSEWRNGWDFTTECPQCHHKERKGFWSAPSIFYEDCEQCGYKGELVAYMREMVWHNGQLVTDKTTVRQPASQQTEGGRRE